MVPDLVICMHASYHIGFLQGNEIIPYWETTSLGCMTSTYHMHAIQLTLDSSMTIEADASIPRTWPCLCAWRSGNGILYLCYCCSHLMLLPLMSLTDTIPSMLFGIGSYPTLHALHYVQTTCSVYCISICYYSNMV